MNEELEPKKIDRTSPIWEASGCNYFSLTAEVNSYWTQFYRNQLNITDELLYQRPTKKQDIKKHNRLIKQLEDGVFGNTQKKTEEFFRELWRDVKKVGFKKKN